MCYIGTPSYSNPGQTGHLSILSHVKRDTFLVLSSPHPLMCHSSLKAYLYTKIELENGEISSSTSSSFAIWPCSEKVQFWKWSWQGSGKHWASRTCPKNSKNILLAHHPITTLPLITSLELHHLCFILSELRCYGSATSLRL